jgi:8-oxo-dGTP pyrophosphatase MutT (NUDIX family)
MPAATKPLYVVALVVRDDRVLVRLRQSPGRMGGRPFLEPPGGKVEPGEPVTAALDREAEEETGCCVLSRELIRVYDDLAPSAWSGLSLIWAVELGGEPRPEPGHHPWVWFPIERLTAGPYPSSTLLLAHFGLASVQDLGLYELTPTTRAGRHGPRSQQRLERVCVIWPAPLDDERKDMDPK